MSENLRPLTALLVAVAAVETTGKQTAAAANNAPDQSAWSGYCWLSENINKIEGNGRARLAGINSLRKKHSETAPRLQLFALLTPTETERTKAAALALWLQEKSETAANAGLIATAGQAIEAAAANYYAKGRVDELLELMWQAKGASHGRLQTGDGNNGSPATKTGGAISSVVCSLDRKQTQRGYFKPGILTATGLGKEPIPTAKGSTKQTNSKNFNLPNVNADGFGGGEPQTATSVTYGGGLFEAAKADAQQTGTHIATLKTATDHKHKIWKNAFMTMDALDKLDTSQHDNKTDDNTPAAELEQAVTAILSEPKNRGQQTPQTNTLRLFAKPISKTIEKFIENVEKHPLKKGNLGVTEDTKLGDITGVPTLKRLLLRVTLAVTQTKDKLENELATRKPDEDVKATGEKQKECNKHHASQHDCDSKDFCTYDKAKDEGKRCVYNEPKASKSGVPVAQAQIEETSTVLDRCIRHKDKANCEKENEGLAPEAKAHCDWIEKKCEDSSFFVHKKLIMIAAIFVSSVEF